MTEPLDDEQWAAGLRERAFGVVPDVPVDVPGAVRRGRRRRRLRTVAVRGAVLAVGCGLAVAVVPSVLGAIAGSSSTDSADSSGAVSPALDSGLRPSGAYDSAPTGPGQASLSPSELAAGVSDGTLPSGTVLVVQDEVPRTTTFLESFAAPGPDTASPTAVTPVEWPTATAVCLDEAGWPVVITGGAWEVEVDSDKATGFLTDLAGCVARYPLR